MCVCGGICRSGNHHWALDIIGGITKCVLWARWRLLLFLWLSLPFFPLSPFRENKNTDLASIKSLKMKHSSGREEVLVKLGT